MSLSRSTAAVRLALLASLGLLGTLAACGLTEPGRELGQFARLEVDCQLGTQATASGSKEPLFRCEFRNVAKAPGSSCVKVKVTPPNAPVGPRGPVAVVSETICSGTLLPDTDRDSVTDSIDLCPAYGAPHEGGGAYSIDPQGCRLPVIHPQTAPVRCGQLQTGRCATEIFLGSVSQALFSLAPRDKCFNGSAFTCVGARDFILATCFDADNHFLCDLQIEELPH